MQTLYDVGQYVNLKAVVESITIKGKMIRYELIMPSVYSSHRCTATENQIDGSYEDPFILFKEEMIAYLMTQPTELSRDRLIDVVKDWHRKERKVVFERSDE